MLKVSKNAEGRPEIFHSIQGEGANIGKPAVFLRLGFCNLKCTWCDAKYTWDWTTNKAKEQLVELSLEEIEREILNYNCKYLVVTGGEPLMQQKQLIHLLMDLKNQSFFIEIETNGTALPDQRLFSIVDHWSVSPKLQNSGNSQSDREIEAVYKLFNSLNTCHFKYVMQSETDLEEVYSEFTPAKLPRSCQTRFEPLAAAGSGAPFTRIHAQIVVPEQGLEP